MKQNNGLRWSLCLTFERERKKSQINQEQRPHIKFGGDKLIGNRRGASVVTISFTELFVHYLRFYGVSKIVTTLVVIYLLMKL